MNHSTFAAVARRAAIRMAGGAVQTGILAAPAVVGAGKTGKSARQRRQKQREQCRATFETYCEGLPTCTANYFPCCEFFAQGRVGDAVACILNGPPVAPR